MYAIVSGGPAGTVSGRHETLADARATLRVMARRCDRVTYDGLGQLAVTGTSTVWQIVRV